MEQNKYRAQTNVIKRRIIEKFKKSIILEIEISLQQTG